MSDRGEFQKVLRQEFLIREDGMKKRFLEVKDRDFKEAGQDEIDKYVDSLFHSRKKDSIQEKFNFSEVMYEVVDLLGRSFAQYYTGNEMDKGTKGRKLAIRILYYPGAAVLKEEEIIIQNCSETVEQVKQIIRDCIIEKQKESRGGEER